MHGEYTVEIYKEELSERKAEELEFKLINEHANQLVNWIAYRDMDYEALELKNKLRKKNMDFVKEIRSLETTNLTEAIKRYREALKNMRGYVSINYQKKTLVAELLVDETRPGDWIIIDRLTLCLKRANRFPEAIEEAEKYFVDFPGILKIEAGNRLRERTEKLKESLNKK